MSLRKIGDYTITRRIGEGAMGTVFQALSPEGVTVAVKTVRWPEGADTRARWDAIARFQLEARAARSLSHPNICQVLDCGADENSLFIVMEFLDGDTVQQLIDLAGRIELQRAVQIVCGVAEGLAHAHGQGIIHRDVKPGNIMILRTGQVKLADFGLASVIGERGVTRTGETMGTPAYMSPEQVRGDRVVDARSDIFSLGTTFYEMVTGTRAFAASGWGAVMQQILTRDPPPPRDVPAYVSRTLEKCLRKKPQDRFQSARELISSLSPVEAEAPPERTAVWPETEEKPTPRPRGPLPTFRHVATWWPALVALALAAVGAAVLRPSTGPVAAVEPRFPPSLTPVKEGLVATYVYGGAGRVQGIASRPDGTLLVTVGPGEGVAPGVYVARPGDDLDASDAYTRPGAPFRSPGGIAVDPDGRVLVADGEAETVWEIPAPGGPAEPLTNEVPSPCSVAVSPSGLRGWNVRPGDLLICAGRGAASMQSGLYVCAADTHRVTRLTGPSALPSDLVGIAFARDGTLYAVEDTPLKDRCSIVSVTSAGKATQISYSLPYDPGPKTGPIAVDPGTGELYFAHISTIYRLPAGGGEPQEYAEGEDQITALAFDPSGSSLLVGLVDAAGSGTLAKVGPYPIEGRLLISASYQSKPPSALQEFAYLLIGSSASRTTEVITPAPEGMTAGQRDLSPVALDQVVYTTERQGARSWNKYSQIWKSDLRGQENVNLSERAGLTGINCHPLWSPDGSRIAFIHCDQIARKDPCKAGLDLWEMNADGSSATRRADSTKSKGLGSESFPDFFWGPGRSSGSGPELKYSYGIGGPSVNRSPDGRWTLRELRVRDTHDGELGVWRRLCIGDARGRQERVCVEWFLPDRDVARHLRKLGLDPDDPLRRDDIRNWTGPIRARWSPSGTHVAFLAAYEFDPEGPFYRYQGEVWVYEVSTGILARLTRNLEQEDTLSWRPCAGRGSS